MIDLAAAKRWLRVEDASDDLLIGGLVSAAVAHIEGATGKYMSVKPFTQVLRGFPASSPWGIRLSKGPVSTIDSIEYDPADGGGPVAIADFRLVEGINAQLLPAYGQSWPSTLDGPGTVRVTGTAGYDDDEAPELDQAALMLVAHWYQNREAVVTGTIATELPLGVQALIAPFRSVGIA